MREAMTKKIIVLGVDGLEPKLAKKFIDKGVMPNLKKFVERGSAREDMVLLGAMPTVTPPMWTTLATGAYPETHGIVAFSNNHPEKLDTRVYSLDSRMCKAEPIWNVFAEAGWKTLVWHWPGSSWPPTSDSPNLHVVDGTQPSSINMGVAVVDWETIGLASEDIADLRFTAYDAGNNPGVGCVITGVEAADATEGVGKGADHMKRVLGHTSEYTTFVMDEDDFEINTLGSVNLNVINSPIKLAEGWANAPKDAKEFMLLTSNGFVRRPALILKNAQGIYDKVAIYKSKKAGQPMLVLEKDVFTPNFVDEVKTNNEIKQANRAMRILELAEDGSKVRFWYSVAYDMANAKIWHPKSLQQDVVENVGLVPQVSMATGKNPEFAKKLLYDSWDNYCEWQGNALNYLQGKYDVIISHLHNVDLIGHQIWHFAKPNKEWGQDATFYQGLIQAVYEQTDRYLGKFLASLDEGWSVIITSDHGLITEENHPPGMGEAGINGTLMKELGYTIFKKDVAGQDLREIDWTKTKALASRGYICLNVRGRNPHGIVEPADQYRLEEQIITDLYHYKDPKTGRRTISMALRTKDAAVLGLNCPDQFDIAYFVEEGFNIIHMDSLSTQCGYFDTSVSPIFVAAGLGIKEGFTTKRVIRQVDVAPTLAALGGVRMPHECEGAPAYQILSTEF